MNVKIRYNTTFPEKSQFEWRLLIDGVENLVNEVRIEVPCWTTSEFIEGHGQKYHLTADANYADIKDILGKKVAFIK